ncbi:hypothetical protein NAPIS_ORF01919 [Vairimorpha apis BRL 01]|uniref:Uncharacterized protein n=1 Tax=Vairimorpha apis BRL 01 TaxID=1037528 RepID=T0MHT9_9MICR|nr:hypothetical protein NAPIS_ORF01919 [Vairimorpha apis BRL 01]
MKILTIIMSLFVIITLCFVVSSKTIQGTRGLIYNFNSTLSDKKIDLGKSINVQNNINNDLNEIISDSQYLTLAFDRILLRKKEHVNESSNIHNICKTTLNELDKNIDKLFHTYYRQKLASYIADNTPSLKFHNKIPLINEVMLLNERYQIILKKSKLNLKKKFTLALTEFNLNKNSIKKQVHKYLHFKENEKVVGKKEIELTSKEENNLIVKENINFIKNDDGLMTRKENVKFVSETGNVIAEEDVEMNEKSKNIHIKEQGGMLVSEENGELVVEENVKAIKNKEDSSKYNNYRYSTLKDYIPITKKDNLSSEDLKIRFLEDPKNFKTENEAILSFGRGELQDVLDNSRNIIHHALKKYKTYLFKHFDHSSANFKDSVDKKDFLRVQPKVRENIKKFIDDTKILVKNDLKKLIIKCEDDFIFCLLH